MRASNQVSAEEARSISALEGLSWQEFERKIDGALKANGWTVWRDRVLPKRYGGEAQRVGRKAGLPDRVAYKWEGRRARMAFIEVKSGRRARLTDEQRGWIDAAAACPGVLSAVVYPSTFHEFVEELGGEYPC